MTKDGTALAVDPAQLITSMFALIPIPIAITDERGRILAANSSFGDTFQEPPVSSALMTTWEAEVPAGVFRMHTLPLNDRGHRILYAEDIQDQVHLRRQVAHMEKMAAIGRMVVGVTTDLSGSFEEIRSFRPIASRFEMEPAARQAFDTVMAEVQRAEGIVEALRRLSNRTAPRRAAIDINRIAQAAVSARSYGNGTRIAEVSLELDAAIPSAIGDIDQIEQVVLSLLVNAEQAITSTQGRPAAIGIRTSLRAGRVQLHVTDNGYARDVSRAFEATHRGVGLALCLEIVKDHGGELFAWSSYGNSTTFTLELPAADSRFSPAKPPVSEIGERLKGKSLLVVDDDVNVTELVYDVLTRCGAEVSVSHSGEAARERLQKRSFDAVVCDWRMPGMDGEAFFDLVKTYSPAAADRFLLITGEAPGVVPARAWSDDKTAKAKMLHKPFRVVELVDAVSGLFNESQPLDS